ncbi:indolepyruvate ferredoxin oxidoreductase subunit alpha [Desulfoluna butyratoxydans]|uniref:Indolepyruvate oxidoreductase subunit IorA n=1 Tax=Desulfoluna butyratoxydans TaxID=231438 RepID=A0A4U8YPK0_9BACT|nr:indolepyruvate ferredoxin oxidoreductase subunit alpha [Desulfoluna butyratoxydans]VFQ45711.1 indolepyruvate ferredoxin oxidoreductase alpha subunit [Desulfoluna butyratoxydans]
MHKLLTDNPGQKMLMLGNEAIARGAIEAGVAFTASYPGTPSSEISLNFFQMSKESDLYFEYSINEKVSVEVSAAAANCGVRSMCVMKHVGMNVAADALLTLAYIGVTGGMVILTADDPFMFSSQNEQDNRYYGKLAGLPVLEPSSVAEAKEMTKQAFELSEALGEPVILRTTTRINHSTGVVELGEITERKTKGDFTKDPMRCVTVPAVSRGLHVKLLANLDKAEEIACTSPLNKVDGSGSLGVIVNGVSYSYVKDGLKDLGATDKVKILRIGFSNPLPKALVLDFIKGCDKVLVVEEGEPFMEEAVKAVAQENGLTLPICGKGEHLFSRLYEFDPKMVRNVMASYFELAPVPSQSVDTSNVPEIPNRPPNLCAGCSHRATFYAVKQATQGMDVMFPSDIGCYTLGFMPPLATGDFVLCMGASTSTSAGFSTVTDKKVISFVGDSTFFHSGIMGLMNAVFNNHNFTLVILDNRITGMTGHQPNPGVDMDEMGFEGYNSIDIEGLVKAAGVKHVSVVRPYNLKKSIAAIKEAVEFEGVSVVIAKEKCTLYAKSLKQLTGKKFQVNPEKCKNHRDCIDTIACPAFTTEGGRVRINEDMCAGCAICAQICPENAILPVKK